MSAVSPATLQILPDQHYKSREDYTWALAEAMREEYQRNRRMPASFSRSTIPPLSMCAIGGFRSSDDIERLPQVGGVPGRGTQPRA